MKERFKLPKWGPVQKCGAEHFCLQDMKS